MLLVRLLNHHDFKASRSLDRTNVGRFNMLSVPKLPLVATVYNKMPEDLWYRPWESVSAV